MTINERLQEAFDKRVGGTAMLPASELLTLNTLKVWLCLNVQKPSGA